MTPTGGAAPGPTPAFPWDDALHFALSRLGWRPAEFWAASPRELAAAIGPTRSALDRSDLGRLLDAFPDPPTPAALM